MSLKTIFAKKNSSKEFEKLLETFSFPKIEVQDLLNDIGLKIKETFIMNKPNIVVIGRTGVGKSFLINTIFHKTVTESRIGGPTTIKTELYEDDKTPVKIYDTRGFELDAQSQQSVLRDINVLANNSNDEHKIHAFWYCVSTESSRFEEAERDWINTLAKTAIGIPIIIVLTKSYDSDDAHKLSDFIEKQQLNGVKCIIPILAGGKKTVTQKPFGVDDLVRKTFDLIPEDVRNAYVSALRGQVELKEKQAKDVANKHIKTAAIIGGAPIPLSDAFFLIPMQITMMIKITKIFGFEIDKAIIFGLLSSLIGCSGATIIGKIAVASLLKLFSGAGAIVGGALSAGVAVSLTVAIGRSYIKIMKRVALGEIKIEDLNSKSLKKEFVLSIKKGVTKQDSEI